MQVLLCKTIQYDFLFSHVAKQQSVDGKILKYVFKLYNILHMPKPNYLYTAQKDSLNGSDKI